MTNKNTLLSVVNILIDTAQSLKNQIQENLKSDKPVTERIKTFEDACNETGINPLLFLDSSCTPDELAYRKLKVIAKALNKGVELTFANSDQKKWYPWFEYKGSGFRFYGAYYGYTISNTAGGSRLCYASEELARYAGTQFIDLYNQLLK
jgi:hypothetical protein